MTRLGLVAAISVALAFALGIQPASPSSVATLPSQRCAAMAKVALPGARVVASALVAAGTFTPPVSTGLEARFAAMPAFCRITVDAIPTPDSRIGIEVWLPVDRWNGRFLGTGNGGSAGSIAYGMGMIEGLKRGFAVATTDMGTAPDIAAAEALPARWDDFGNRSTHEMTKAAKTLLRAFYGVRAVRSYFEGCSTGGQQALVEAQRFPEDYDGILAGAPGNNRTHGTAYYAWTYQAVNAVPGSKMTLLQWGAVTRAILADCAGKDGGAPGDQFLTDPRRCRFDVASLPRCTKDSRADECFTQAQLAALGRLYAGAMNPRTGERIYPGLTPGSESLPLGPVRMNDPAAGSRLFVMRWALGNDFDPLRFDFDRDMDRLDARLAPTLNANKADLSPFALRGGKLLIYNGLADPGVPFADTINYYERVLAIAGYTRGRDFARLFLVPGMGHCIGGPGATEFGQP